MQRRVIALLCVVSVAACSGAGSPSGFSPAIARPTVSARNARPHSNYEFWFYNDDASGKLHVWNTYGGNCTRNQLPRTELDPGKDWSGVLDTDDSGWCAISTKDQDVLLWFDDGIKTGNFIELSYSKTFGGDTWNAQKIGGDGGYRKASVQAPVRTRCQRNLHGLIVCSVGNAALSRSIAASGATARSLQPHVPYDFSFYNDDATATLHVSNTHRGNCTYNDLPTTELAPGKDWKGWLDTDDHGWCAFAQSSQSVLLWFDDDIKSGNFIELGYEKTLGADTWRGVQIGGNGGYSGSSTVAPVRTRCQRNHHGLIVCSLGDG